MDTAAADGVTFSELATPTRFALPRHTLLYAPVFPWKGAAVADGPQSVSSRRITVFALDIAARHRVQFAMPETEAVALMKQAPQRAAGAVL